MTFDRLCSEFVTAFAAASVDNFATTRRFHACAESVDFLAASFAALVSSFHLVSPKNGFNKGL